MDRVNGANWVDIGGGNRGFRDEDVVAGVTGTDVPAAWLNGLQENLMTVIEKEGLAGDIDDWELLWKALQIARAQSGAYRSVEAFANDPPGAPEAGETWIVGAAPTGAFVGHDDELAEWSGSGWTFAAPTPWMHVGLADRTDWRWDHTLGAPEWVLWEGDETIAGPVRRATSAEVANGTGDGFITPQLAIAAPASGFVINVQQSIPNSVYTQITNPPSAVTENYVDTIRNNCTITIGPKDAGWWTLSALGQIVSGDQFAGVVLKNGLAIAEDRKLNGDAINITPPDYLAAGDVITFQFLQGAGATQQVTMRFSGVRHGA